MNTKQEEKRNRKKRVDIKDEVDPWYKLKGYTFTFCELPEIP